MYFNPKPVKCPKCGHTGQYSPSMEVAVPVVYGMPVCPDCFADFIKANVPVLEYVEPTK